MLSIILFWHGLASCELGETTIFEIRLFLEEKIMLRDQKTRWVMVKIIEEGRLKPSLRESCYPPPRRSKNDTSYLVITPKNPAHVEPFHFLNPFLSLQNLSNLIQI
eukprot:TRINITY_DN4583_c0_g2_i6.p1 TRINITY_DN4583_c0_g2~~TRINITY_DN4583_c0_g2_i6.p1  ORF type:complete len:106 (-),score=18.46 TRINITY_DN4583_c0_g2_i6:277-594(-)